MSAFNSPAQELFLELSRAQGDLNQSRQETWATPEMMDRLIEYSVTNPQGSSALGMALAQGGIPGGDPMAQQLVNQELAIRENQGPIETAGEGFWDDLAGIWTEAVYEPVKGATRWGMSAWDAAYNMVAGGAPIRAMMLSSQTGQSFGEAWQEQDPYFFEALGGVFAGEQVNLGSGFLPSSDVAPDVQENVNMGMMELEQSAQGMSTNEKYRHILEGSPEVWSNAVSQSLTQGEMGRPLTELANVAAESVMFSIPRLGGGTSYTPWSPGRIGASTVWEPGSTGFKYASGTGDFLSQMFADPVEWTGLGWAKLGRAGRLLKSSTTRAADEVVEGIQAGQMALPMEAGRATDEAMAARPVDETREAARQLAIPQEASAGRGVIDPETGATGQMTPRGRKIPWWYSGAQDAKPSALNAFDAPAWFVERIRRVQNSIRGRHAATSSVPGKKTSAHFRSKGKGIYEMDLPRAKGARQEKINIRRVGKGKDSYWDVRTSQGEVLRRPPEPRADPRFSDAQEPGFRTLDEARKAASSYAYGSTDSLKYKGMTPEDFIDSGDDFYIEDGISWLASQVADGPRPPESMTQLKRSSRSKPFDDNNIKVRVFGKQADVVVREIDGVSVRTTEGLDQGLIDALRADKKIRTLNGTETIAANPNLDKMTNTRRWMEENGYGKLAFDDENILISEKFVGGDPMDPGQRFWTERPYEPMRTIDPGGGVEPMRSISQMDNNEMIEWYIRTGREIPDELAAGDVALAEKIRLHREAEQLAPTIDGVRVDYDEEQVYNTLAGKRADMFVARLASTTRAAGQTNRAVMDKMLAFLKKQNVHVPAEFRKALFEAPDEAAVRAIFARMMTENSGGQLLLPGSQYGRFASSKYKMAGGPEYSPDRPLGVKWTDKPFFARRAAKMLPSREINFYENPAEAYNVLDDILPNYNVKRGDVLKTEDGRELAVEDVFDRLLNIKPGDDLAAQDAINDLSQILFTKLVDDGASPDLAKQATRFFTENKGMIEYNTARLGQGNIKNGPVDELVIDDMLVGGLDGPQITAQAWNGSLSFPDAHTTKVIVNQTDALGRLANSITNKIVRPDDAAGLEIQRRAWNLFMTNTMNRVWKPFVLLRGAWTLRILMDDQLRIASDGYGMFNHPLRVMNYALTQSKDWRTAFTKGHVDVFGQRMTVDNVNDLMHGDLLQRAMMAKGDPRVGNGSFGYKHRSAVPRTDPKYVRGQASNVRMLRADPITSALAGVDPKEDAVATVTKYLQGFGDQASRQSWIDARTRLAKFNNRMPDEVQQKIIEGDYETIYKIVSHQDAMMRQTVGGRVVYDDGVGGVRDYTQFKKVDDVQSDMSGIPKWRTIDAGDTELLDVVAKRNSVVGDLQSDESMKGLESLLRNKVDGTADRFPEFTLVSDPGRVPGGHTFTDDYDKAVTGMYEIFMTMPSDKFSRVPMFRKAYWDKMGQLSRGMTDEAAAEAEKMAKAANAIGEFRSGQKLVGKMPERNLSSLEQADYLAKAFGLTAVDRTLFDLVNKRNISDSLNLIFPFVEAWGEFISRWGRMMVTGDKNIANMRRLQQGVEGLRQDSGFFHENEYGQEVFAYPAFLTKGQMKVHNLLNNIPGVSTVLGADIDPAMADSVKFQGNAESLNFASSFIPGFGPVFQLAAKSIPDDPAFDFVRDIVAPYGTDGTIGQFMPAWVKRIASAHGGYNDPTLQYTWTSTVQDTLRVMMNEGEFAGVTSAEDVNELVKQAEEKARGLLMVRAAATWWVPASPSAQWTTQDVDGEVWTFSNLGDEYRKIQEELEGDEIAAFDEFHDRFGFLPAPFTRGKTYGVYDRSLTKEGSAFQRGNEQLFAQYPLSAMYLDPTIGIESEYDHSAMLSQLQRSEREQWTAEQMVYLQQDQYGDLMMDNKKEQSMLVPKGEARNAFIAAAREQVSALYPYWNKQIPGKVQGARNDEQMAEVIAWTKDPDLIGTPVVDAVRQYLKQRNDVLKHIEAEGASTIDGPTSTETRAGMVATMGREWLRGEAEVIIGNHPEFENVFRAVFASEVDQRHDALPEIGPEATTLWGEDDIMNAVLGVTDAA